MRKKMRLKAVLFSLAWWMVCISSAHAFTHKGEGLRQARIFMPSRDFIYMVGDVITVGAEIIVDRAYAPAKTIHSERMIKIHDWLELTLAIDTKHTASVTQYRFHFQYQIFQVPIKTMRIEIPPYSIPMEREDGKPEFTIMIPAFPFSLTPISTDEERKEMHVAPDFIPRSSEHREFSLSRYAAFGTGFLFTMLVFVPWIWMCWRVRRNSCFRNGWRRVRNETDAMAACSAVYKAIHEYAGRVYFPHEQKELVARYSVFRDAFRELAEFFARSDAFFFGVQAEATTEYGRTVCVCAQDLLKKLMKAEKKQRRQER